MPKLWTKAKDTTDTADLQEVDLSTLKITSPTVVFISGRETTDKNLREISKSIHYMHKILDGSPQIYSWSHSGQLSRLFNMIVYHQFPKRAYRPSAMKLAKGIILPLVSGTDGKPLPFAEAQKNLRNLTLLGYSAGSIVAQELFNASMKMMQKTGYTAVDARGLLHEVALVNIGTVSRPTKERNRFTTISLANSDDWFVRAKNFIRHPLTHIFLGAGRGRKLRIRELSTTSLLITAAARKRFWERGKGSKEIISGVKLKQFSLLTSNHEAADYINKDDEHSQFSRFVQYALNNAVNRKETLSPLQLLVPPADLAEEEEKRYQERIDAALKAAREPPLPIRQGRDVLRQLHLRKSENKIG